MVAGEASGDLLGAHLIAALKARRRDMEFSGIGGPRMAEQGFEVIHSMDKLGVRGYAEVLKQYREIKAVQKDLIRQFLDDPPELFIGIDSSDFNLDIARKLKDKGVRAIQYVSPAIWAWRGWRIQRIARSVSHILALFPFEPELYQEAGVPVTYVGHPLADMIPLEPNRQEARQTLRLPLAQPIVALLPGSRKAELHYMADLFVKTAKSLIQDLEGMDAGDEMFNAKFTVLSETVRHHVKEERDEMFPRVRATKIDLKALGQKMLARREQLMKSNGSAASKSRPVRRKSHARGESRAPR